MTRRLLKLPMKEIFSPTTMCTAVEKGNGKRWEKETRYRCCDKVWLWLLSARAWCTAQLLHSGHPLTAEALIHSNVNKM